MEHPEPLNFTKIAAAIRYIEDHFKDQPSLEKLAAHAELSPTHFQRLFTHWAGTSPKNFLQYMSIEHAKKLLAEERAPLLTASLKTGLSGSGRLHDLFLKIEGMTPGEYKNGGAQLVISYNITESPFGEILLGSTPRGLCYLAFVDASEGQALLRLQSRFPNATFIKQSDHIQESARSIFTEDWSRLSEVKLHLKGTPFQLKVWEALLRIPMGKLTTYARIAQDIQNPHACRAVGTAIGDNPIAFLIPCHRVIQSTGVFGNYHWGHTRKTAMIGWEGVRSDPPPAP